MDRKIKLAATVSLLALTAAACAPNPYYSGYNYGNRTNTQTGTAVNRAAVSHTHCGRTHSHALPPEGLAHHHGDGCLAGSGGGTATNTTANNNYSSYGYNNPQPANTYNYPTPTTTPYYDYSAGNSSSYGGYTGGNYSTYVEPKASTNTYNNYRSPSASTATSRPAPGGSTYTVQKGDTVFQVMRNTGIYWKDIIRLNNLRAPDYTITPGQTLKLK